MISTAATIQVMQIRYVLIYSPVILIILYYFLSLSLSFTLSFSVSLPLFFSPSHFLSLTFSHFLSLSISLSLSLSLSSLLFSNQLPCPVVEVMLSSRYKHSDGTLQKMKYENKYVAINFSF